MCFKTTQEPVTAGLILGYLKMYEVLVVMATVSAVYVIICHPQPMYQLVLTIPANGSYSIVARYISLRLSSFPVPALLTQGLLSRELTFRLRGSGSCGMATSGCYEQAITGGAGSLVVLNNQPATLVLRLSGAKILLVSMHQY